MEAKRDKLDGRDPSQMAQSMAEKDPLGPGRLSVYAALGAAAGTIPLPFLPDMGAKRVCGALAQDVCSRHGLSLTPEAREVLAAPFGGGNGVLGFAVRYAAGKFLTSRFSPIGFLAPVRSALFTFSLGHLLARYIQSVRTDVSVRVDGEEARRIRRLIDDALATTLSLDLRGEAIPVSSAPEDLRDAVTRVLDSVIIAGASVPDWMVRRLDAAFDRCVQAERR